MNRRYSGLRAKRNGENFEKVLCFFAKKSGFNFVVIPSGCKTIGANKIIRVKSPFDFIFSNSEKTIFIDAKTTNEKTFSYSKIDQSQIKSLLSVKNKNNEAGYVVSVSGDVYFVPVFVLASIKKGESIDFSKQIFLGRSKEEIDLNKITGNLNDY